MMELKRPHSTAERLRQIMQERGLKQADILRLCEPYCKQLNVKMGRNDLSQYVAGKIEPGQYKLIILGRALNVNETWLMGFDVPRERDAKSDLPDLPAYSLNLKHFRIARGLGTADAASRSEVTTKQWLAWERGTEVPTEEELIRAAKTLRVTPRKLLEKREEEEEPETIPGIYPVRKKSFPVLGKVACGEPIFAEEDHETSIMASADIDADFCLIAQGDSMTGAHIEDGDIVFIRQMEVVPNGKIAVVLIEDEATLKYIEYRPEQATLILTPANPAFRTQIYSGEELNQIRVLGMAVALQKDLTRR